MFERYKTTREDFAAIEEGIKTVWRPELNFIFKRKNLLENIVIISYDSSFIYLWTKISFSHLSKLPCGLSNYYTYKIPHKIKLKDEWQHGWISGLPTESLDELIPERLRGSLFKIPKISGGLLTPFIELQKKKNIKYNPYVTRESFLATVVHEFGHAYWQQHKLWWYSDKKENIKFLQTAKQLYEGKKSRRVIYFPIDPGFSELYAFLAEYTASGIFWKSHKRTLDVFIQKRLEVLIKKEHIRDLDREDSVLTPERYPHDFAFVFGKIILSNFSKNWSKILTDRELTSFL